MFVTKHQMRLYCCVPTLFKGEITVRVPAYREYRIGTAGIQRVEYRIGTAGIQRAKDRHSRHELCR